MGCCHYYAIAEGRESAFSVDPASIVFGPGVLAELGEHALALGMKRVALFTDKRIARLPFFAAARDSLRRAGVGYDDGDIAALCEGAYAQRRLLTNSPRPVDRGELAGLYRGAMQYW